MIEYLYYATKIRRIIDISKRIDGFFKPPVRYSLGSAAKHMRHIYCAPDIIEIVLDNPYRQENLLKMVEKRPELADIGKFRPLRAYVGN